MPARETLDSDLGVLQWAITRRRSVQLPVAEEGAPSWWHGDDEAADSFMRAMGVHL